jgi:hypothetical protein
MDNHNLENKGELSVLYEETIKFESSLGETKEKRIFIFDWDDTLFCTKYIDIFCPDYNAIFSGRSCLEELGRFLVDEVLSLEQVNNHIINRKLFTYLSRLFLLELKYLL